MSSYFIGGLEPRDDDQENTMTVDGTTYIVSDKFKVMLRDSIIDWGTFLEVYNNNVEYRTMFDQIIKLLNIKENSTIHDMMLPLVKKIYHLPAIAHLASMLRQFMIYEPISIAIHATFNHIKHHYEYIVEKFVEIRNKYIKHNKLTAKYNDWKKLIKRWNEANEEKDLDSSSIILLFLNPPDNLKPKLHITIPGVDTTHLKNALKHFQYPGFCPKVPHQRLIKLLKFPINHFVRVIKQMEPTFKFPNYTKVEKSMSDILDTKLKKPEVPDIKNRESPPDALVKTSKLSTSSENLSDSENIARINLAKWYVRKILEFRKMLLPSGKAYEKYYEENARRINDINSILKKELPIS